MYTARDMFSRQRHLIFFILGTIIGFWLLYALRSAILPFVLGLVLAYLFLPIIKWVEMRLPCQGRWLQTKRISLIILTYVVILGLVGFFSYLITRAVVNAFLVIMPHMPQYISAGLLALQEWIEVFKQQFLPETQQEIDKLIFDIGQAGGNAIRDVFMKGFSFVPATIGLIFGFAALPIFLFYILKDSEKLRNGFYSALSPWVAEHARNTISIIERVLGRYIRAQVVLGFIVAYLCLVGLLILKINFAVALAALAGLTELIPILGPWISGAIAVIVTLAIAPEKAIWVAFLFLLVQLLENNLLVPRIQGAYLRLHPAIIIVLLVLGAKFAGIWGMILVVPLTATIVEIYKYVRQSVKMEEIQEQLQP